MLYCFKQVVTEHGIEGRGTTPCLLLRYLRSYHINVSVLTAFA